MSSPWIQGVLRRELGWDGAVLTDDMEMGAVGARMPLEDACVAAIRAGCDGLLICKTLELIEGAARRLDAEIERDPAFRARCLEARRRLDRLAATRPRPAPAAELLAHLGVPEHQLLAQGGASAFDPTERQG
jgi:beta-N-acetylhexosaminidase